MMKYFEKNIIGRIVLKVCLSPMMKPYFGGLHCPKGTKKPRNCVFLIYLLKIIFLLSQATHSKG